jgi:hypothetical protein
MEPHQLFLVLRLLMPVVVAVVPLTLLLALLAALVEGETQRHRAQQGQPTLAGVGGLVQTTPHPTQGVQAVQASLFFRTACLLAQHLSSPILVLGPAQLGFLPLTT